MALFRTLTMQNVKAHQHATNDQKYIGTFYFENQIRLCNGPEKK